jgi:hypothetical protein
MVETSPIPECLVCGEFRSDTVVGSIEAKVAFYSKTSFCSLQGCNTISSFLQQNKQTINKKFMTSSVQTSERSRKLDIK